MRVDRLVLLISAFVFIGFGLAFVVAPTQLAALVDIKLTTSRAVVELATVYGGLELGLGAALFACAKRNETLKTGLRVSFCALLGVSGVRLIGMVVHGADATLVVLFIAEAVGAAASLWGLKWQPQPHAGTHQPPV